MRCISGRIWIDNVIYHISRPLFCRLFPPPSSHYLPVYFIASERKWGEETQAAAGISIMNMFNTWNIIQRGVEIELQALTNKQLLLLCIESVIKGSLWGRWAVLKQQFIVCEKVQYVDANYAEVIKIGLFFFTYFPIKPRNTHLF